MTLQELITDLKAAGANANTIRLAMNCYELGKGDGVDAEWVARRTKAAVEAEREACATLCDQLAQATSDRHDAMAANRNDKPELYMTGKELGACGCASAIRARGQHDIA